MKNLNATKYNTSQRSDLVNNLKQMTNDVMIWRHKVLREVGLTKPGYFLMNYVNNRGPLKLTECSMRLGVSKPTITKLVDNLEKDRLVERIKKDDDRRSYYVHLTDSGRKKFETLNRQLEDVFHVAIEDLIEDQIRELNSSISSIRERLRSISI